MREQSSMYGGKVTPSSAGDLPAVEPGNRMDGTWPETRVQSVQSVQLVQSTGEDEQREEGG